MTGITKLTIAIVLAVLIAAGTATAATLITSSMIKDGTIRAVDMRTGAADSRVIRNGTIGTADLSDGKVAVADNAAHASVADALSPSGAADVAPRLNVHWGQLPVGSTSELVFVAAHDMGGGAVTCPHDNPGLVTAGGIVSAGFQPMHLNANGSISQISTQAESTAIVPNASYPTFDAGAVNWTGEHINQWQFLFENTGDTDLAVRLFAVCMGENGDVIRTSP